MPLENDKGDIRVFVVEGTYFFFENVEITTEITTESTVDPVIGDSVLINGILVVPIEVTEKMNLDIFLANLSKSHLEVIGKQLSNITSALKKDKKTKSAGWLVQQCLLYKYLSFDKVIANPLTIIYNAIAWFVTFTMKRFTVYSDNTKPMVVPGVYDSGKREPMSFYLSVSLLDKFVSVTQNELENAIKPIIKKT